MAEGETAGRRSGPVKEAAAKARLEGLASYLADPNARDFDRLVYERIRLGILSALAVNDTQTFTELKRFLATTDGNLSVHAQKLEAAKYIACKKSFRGRIPRTEYRITQAGRKALDKYLAHMERLIQSVRSR